LKEWLLTTSPALVRSTHTTPALALDDLPTSPRSLKPLLERRGERLHESLVFQQLKRDLESEIGWLEQKRPAASATDLGDDVTAVVNLQKRHTALTLEVEGR
jgi:hypothetical protein